MSNHLFKLTLDETKSLCEGLRKIPVRQGSEKNNYEEIWYQGNERYFDIFANHVNGKAIWFQITFRGHYAQWDPQCLKTGLTNEFENNSPNRIPATKLMTGERELNKEFIFALIEILKISKDPFLQNLAALLV